MQKNALVGMVLVLVAFTMVGLSLIMPWYEYEMKMSYMGVSESMSVEFYLDHATAEVGGEPDDLDYNDADAEDVNWVQTFKTTQILVFLGLLGCVIGMIGAAMVLAGKLRPMVGAFFIVFAILLSLLAPLYLMFTLPDSLYGELEESAMTAPFDEMGENFFGSQEEEFMGVTWEVKWGGSIGWFLTIISAVICIIAFIFVAISKPAPTPLYPEMPMAQDMYAEPYAAPLSQPSTLFYPEQTEIYPQVPYQEGIRPQDEEFQCPNCSRIFIISIGKRPAILRCPYCGLEGLVE